MLKSFSQFIFERKQPGQLQQMNLAVAVEMPDNQYIFDSVYNQTKLWNIFTKQDEPQYLHMPTLNYSNWQTTRLIKAGMNPELVYNKKEAKKKVSGKKAWHMLHEGSIYIPSTVYRADDVKNLSFPVVAKPDNRYAGQGIVVFERPEDFQNVQMESFSVFSEKIDIVEESRVFCWRGQPLVHMFRVPADNETKALSKDPEAKLSFNYELSEASVPEDMIEAIREFAKVHDDLDFYSVDFARSKDQLYVIEMSSEPGPCFGVMGHVYKCMYQDHYGQPIDQTAASQIDQWIKEDINATITSDPDRFSIRKQ